MDNDHQPNGHPPQMNGSHAQASSGPPGWLRTPTVKEALPYTPFSSIVPFNPEIIPAPIARPPPNVNYGFGNHQASRHVLDQLSAQAKSAETASRRCQQTLLDVQKLLDPDSVSNFEFKKPRQIASWNSTSQSQNNRKAPVLSSFAKMVLDATDVPFRYLTPESPEPQTARKVTARPNNVHHGLTTPSSESTDVKLPHLQQNGTRPSQDAQIGPSSQTLQAVVLSNTLTPAQRAEYQYVADTNMDTKKRQSLATPSARTLTVDQRQKAEAAVQELQGLLNEIFEAEDQMSMDADGASISTSVQLLSLADSDEGPIAVLQPATQEKLDSAVLSVAKYGRIDGIEIEQLVRAQKLSERAVTAAASQYLQIEDDWSEEDAQYWHHKLGRANSGLLGARTLLRIMTVGRQEKELQSEDTVRIILELLKSAIETGLVPVIEERSYLGEKGRGADKSQQNPKFVVASRYRDSLKALLQSVTKTFRLLANLLSRVDVDESAISSIVYMCKSLIFAENATNDKDSVMGIQAIETTRKHAMDVLARVFTRYHDQRQFVIDEVLVSLEKLPGTKQSARQFRLPDGKPIQLVSALLMRLVQTSATKASPISHSHNKTEGREDSDENSDTDMEDEESDADDDEIKVSPSKKRGPPADLAALVKPLHDAAAADASYIVRILINRASATAKNADEPYRKLLDIFTEDFLNVLASSDWPAAELLLRTMLTHMINIAENHKSPVPSRNLALELIGTMGSGILQLQLQARSTARNIDTAESEIASNLVNIFEQLELGEVDNSTFYGFEGPYRVVLEYLQARDNGSDASLQTARGFHLVQWAHHVSSGRDSSVDSNNSGTPGTSKDIQNKLRHMILDPQWLEDQQDFDSVSTAAGRLSAALVVLNKTFCKAFPRLFGVLLTAMTDEHSTVKSRSLKSVIAVLEKDPSVLDRNRSILKNIFRCAEDNSPLVRESALGLIGRCISLRPELDGAVFEQVIVRTHDPAIGVRKRALKMLKDIYLRNDAAEIRSSIANAIISRVQDAEESITELARVTMEEIWFAPFHGLSLQGDNPVQAKLQYRAQADLLIQTVDLGDSVLRVLESLLREVLNKSKTAPANSRVCKVLIDVLFDGIVDPSELPGSPTQEMILQTLTVFAKACPTLIDSDQLERLAPYTKNLTTDDDLAVFRSVLVILRQTMPHVKTFKSDFLKTIQSSLMASIPKLPKIELPEVAACLWTIDGELKNTERLINLVISALANVRSAGSKDLATDAAQFKKANKLMSIVGAFGKACDFEFDLEDFRVRCNMPKAHTVSGMAIDILCAFTSPKQPLAIRESAMEAICSICQRWPKQFLRADVINAFDLALKEHVQSLEHIFVSGLEGFFALQAVPTDAQGGAEKEVAVTGRERFANTYTATDQDGASSALAQRFLQDILRLSLASNGDVALTATKLIASILQQGLPHPKECGPSLVALETSPNAAIARIAFNEHRAMHQKHETTIEKEYVRSIHQSFVYQKEVVGSVTGFVGSPPAAKLHFFWEVLKSGKVKVRQKFIGNIAQRMEFDPADLEDKPARTSHLAFVRYCCENLAFFDYDRTDDVLLLLSSLEKVFSGVGTAVAQSIESDVQMLSVAATLSTEEPITTAPPTEPTVEPSRLETLATSSQILLLIWETRTFLQRLWNMSKQVRTKTKAIAKDTSKPPTRAANAPALTETYLRRMSQLALSSADPEKQRAICEQFVEVISVDTETKVPSEDEDGLGATEEGETASETASRKSPSVTPGKGRKRKSTGSAAPGTPRKRGRPSGSGGAKRKSAVKFDDEGDVDADADADGEWV